MKYTVHFVPHTHYDAEVFMTEAQTLELGYSILLGAMRELEINPDYRFALDQTCYIAPFLKNYPEERERLERFIAEGRLEITCGMHVMPDVNIPCGESFIRQVMEGKSWCRRELGVEIGTGWLLDTFGQHAQIPQLMRGCGFDVNVFQRLGTYDGPTEHYWRGLDGTKLFCHRMRGSYALLYPLPGTLPEFKRFVDQRLDILRPHALTPHLLAISGADLTHVQPHVAAMFEAYHKEFDDVEFRFSTPREYFDTIRDLAEFPEVTGERNPVFQGTYSARIKIKQTNRHLECQLLDAEAAQAMGSLAGADAPEEGVDDAWRGVLFNQFHDIICGCQTDAVYEHVMERYTIAEARTGDVREPALKALADQVDTSGEGVPIVVLNPLSWERTDVVECWVGFVDDSIHELEVRSSSDELAPCDLLAVERHPTGGIKRARILFIATDVPSMGYEVYRVLPASGEALETPLDTNQPPFFHADMHTDIMESDLYRLEIDAWNGAIRSLIHKPTMWDAVDPERPYAGTIAKERDFGNFWEYNGHCKGDAFLPMNRSHPLPTPGEERADFSHLYGGDGRVTKGQARVEYNVGFAFGTGYFATRVRLYPGIERVDIHTTLINGDKRVRYRAAFPTSLRQGAITHEIPFGAVERPEGEFPAQSWMDVSDGTRGLAILNRGLPGNNVEQGVAMLSLLKCTALDEGYGEVGGYTRDKKTSDGYELGVRHEFDYALVPHGGTWREADLVRRGQELNRPLIPVKTAPSAGRLPARHSFVQVAHPSVAASALRRDGERLVLRVYETQGREARGVTVTVTADLASAWVADLLGNTQDGLAVASDGRSIDLDLQPFQIVTVVLECAPSS
ncbi:MAG: hypothetical protein GF320_05335 [Armatimonadia bacterium]|nr:hypothetical protein [Armatimonadia bacterium]